MMLSWAPAAMRRLGRREPNPSVAAIRCSALLQFDPGRQAATSPNFRSRWSSRQRIASEFNFLTAVLDFIWTKSRHEMLPICLGERHSNGMRMYSCFRLVPQRCCASRMAVDRTRAHRAGRSIEKLEAEAHEPVD